MTTNQQADRLAEEAKTWISQVCIAAHRRSPAQTKVAVEALEAFIEALATLARTPSVPDDVASIDNARCKFAAGGALCVSHCGDPICVARASHEGEKHGQA